MSRRVALLGGLLFLGLKGAPALAADKASAAKEKWVQLFDGKSLKGWTPKIRGSKLGDNYGNTFRVEDGVLKVVYDKDKYETFDDRFGHLAYKKPFSNYRLRVEYRFVGDQVKGGPTWAYRNSGIMIFGQTPQSMGLNQNFPISVEVQLLGGDGKGPRSTASMCSPGTNVVIDGKLITEHCVKAKAKTYEGDQWVSIEVEVHGSRSVKHIIDGEPVIEYSEPQLDERDPEAQALLKTGAKKILDAGYIYLQSESHPVEFRKVEILELKN